MMPGVEILNVIVETGSGFGWSPVGFVLLTLAAIFAMFFIVAYTDNETEMAIFTGIATVIFLFASLLFFGTAREINTYSYEVRVEDSVQMNEFLERYNILDHRDKIYVIQEYDEEATHINRLEE